MSAAENKKTGADDDSVKTVKIVVDSSSTRGSFVYSVTVGTRRNCYDSLS